MQSLFKVSLYPNGKFSMVLFVVFVVVVVVVVFFDILYHRSSADKPSLK